ncbi:MAG: ABC transporter permease [Burkholderiaceae bacterium]|nr:ABC transporter permease [Burkholderiaceae bacterium]
MQRLAALGPAKPVPTPAFNEARAVIMTRVAILAAILVTWELVARSGLLYRDVVPPLPLIAKEFTLLFFDRGFYWHLAVTTGEVLLALAIGGGSGILVGVILGRNRYLGGAFEPLIYYLGPTPKIIFFPILIMWFGVGMGSKVAMGALSCFFPVAISVASAMRQVDSTLIRVGLSFRLSAIQMFTKIFIPAMRIPVLNGIRIGLGVAIVGTLLAETKLANQGLGYAVIQTYVTFNMPRMYALLLVVFLLAVGVNSWLGRYTEMRMTKKQAAG